MSQRTLTVWAEMHTESQAAAEGVLGVRRGTDRRLVQAQAQARGHYYPLLAASGAGFLRRLWSCTGPQQTGDRGLTFGPPSPTVLAESPATSAPAVRDTHWCAFSPDSPPEGPSRGPPCSGSGDPAGVSISRRPVQPDRVQVPCGYRRFLAPSQSAAGTSPLGDPRPAHGPGGLLKP